MMLRKRYRASRFRLRPAVMTISAILWVLLWSSLSPFIVLSGALIGWLIGVLFPLPPMFWKGKVRPIQTIYLALHLLWDLVVSSIRLIGYAFERKVNLHAGIVRVELHSDDDLYQVGVASMISLVPGTVVVEVVRHPRRLYLHVLGLDGQTEDDVQTMADGVERRLLRAFGSKHQIAAFEDAIATPTVVPATDWAAEEADASEDSDDESDVEEGQG